MADALAVAAAVLASAPVLMSIVNLAVFRAPAATAGSRAVSVIVPARNEAAAIGACLAALQASRDVAMEVIVVDDDSTDATATIVQRMAAADPRLRLHRAGALPPDWSGKPHACQAGAMVARNPVLLFLDTDVTVAHDALARLSAALDRMDVALLSGFPRQRTVSLGEVLMVPMIHLLLLGYLPIPAMRRSGAAGFAAGCGQAIMVEAAGYWRAGGHGDVRTTWHDGLALPRAFRRHGLRTDLCDITSLATCRMYEGFAASWRGFSKNAGEGMATSVALPIWTVLLFGAFVLPFLLLVQGGAVAAWTCAAVLAVRLALALRFRQSLLTVPLLPVATLLLLALQWTALLRRVRGRPQTWRGRPAVAP